MGQDVFGNYIADVHPTFGDSGGGGLRSLYGVHGVPSVSLGQDGDHATDLDTGDVWVKVSGAWGLLSAGSGLGVTQVFAYEGDPNGHQACTGPGVCWGKGSTNGALWRKNTAGTSNNEWEEVFAAP